MHFFLKKIFTRKYWLCVQIHWIFGIGCSQSNMVEGAVTPTSLRVLVFIVVMSTGVRHAPLKGLFLGLSTFTAGDKPALSCSAGWRFLPRSRNESEMFEERNSEVDLQTPHISNESIICGMFWTCRLQFTGVEGSGARSHSTPPGVWGCPCPDGSEGQQGDRGSSCYAWLV